MSADAPQNPTKGESLAAITRPYGSLKDLDPAAVLEEINKVLGIEDPEFSRTLASVSSAAELNTAEPLESLNIPSLEKLTAVQANGAAAPVGHAKFSLAESVLQVREEFQRACAKSVNGARDVLISIRELLKTPKAVVPILKKGVMSTLAGLKKIKPLTFVKLVAVLVLLGLCGFILKKTFNGGLFPAAKPDMLTSLSQVADKNYAIEADEEMEEFNSPLRHPEYVVALDKVVVNLKSNSAATNPMGMFEFYIEAATRDAAIEINDRKNEVKDSMSRTIETMTYEDIITFEGKNKLKADLAHDVNGLLTHGRVRRVYFKSIVLKP